MKNPPLKLVNGALEGQPFKVGDRVMLDKFFGATIKHLGPVAFASGVWVGLSMDEPQGKNNGTVQGKSYFECSPKHGIFTRASRLTPEPTMKPGEKVVVQQKYVGVVRFFGPTHLGPGNWVGVELRSKVGRNDGSIDGNKYFVCDPGHGIFTRIRNVSLAASTIENSPKLQVDSISTLESNTVTSLKPQTGLSSSSSSSNTSQDVAKLEGENDRLRAQVASLEAELSQMKAAQATTTTSEEVLELRHQLDQERSLVGQLRSRLESTRSTAQEAMEFQDQTKRNLVKARSQLEQTEWLVEDMAIARDADQAERDLYFDLYQENSDRVAAIQMDLLDARQEVMQLMTELDDVRYENEQLLALLESHGIDPSLSPLHTMDPLESVKQLLTKCQDSPSARAAASRVAGVKDFGGQLVLDDESNLSNTKQLLEDAYLQSRAQSPPTTRGSHSSSIHTSDDDHDDEEERTTPVVEEEEDRPSPPPGIDSSLFCTVCEEYGHVADECDDTLTF